LIYQLVAMSVEPLRSNQGVITLFFNDVLSSLWFLSS
jgi:hypothetical protein